MQQQVDRETRTHMMEHVQYPATGREIMQECNNMSHVPEADRQMVQQRLDPDKTYRSASEAMADLNR